MPMTHVDQYEYPVFAQATPSFPIALKIVTGQADDLTVADKVKTLHTVASFALGTVFPHEHPEMNAAPNADLLALSQWADPGVTPAAEMRGINWKALLLKLLPLILTLLTDSE